MTRQRTVIAVLVFAILCLPSRRGSAPAALIALDNTSDRGGALGYTAGGDLWNPGINTNPPVRIGSNSADSNTWGTGQTASATGPDVGSTWRGNIVVRASSVLDADPTDSLNSITDLNHRPTALTLTLSVGALGAANTPTYAPQAYYNGVITQTSATSGYWGAWDTAAQGADSSNTVAGAYDDADNSGSITPGDLYEFTFSGISGLQNTTDFISFAVVGNANAVANEELRFNNAQLEVVAPQGIGTLLVVDKASGNGGTTGWMSGGDLYKPEIGGKPEVYIGSNSADSNTWGTNQTSAATGPDIGSTWRGALTLRASQILDADPGDAFDTAGDLNHRAGTMEVTLPVSYVGPNTSPDYAPELYYHGVVHETNASGGYWAAWEKATRGAAAGNTVAGIFDDVDNSGGVSVGDLYTFSVDGIDGLVRRADFLTFGIVGNQNTVADETLRFDPAIFGFAALAPKGTLVTVDNVSDRGGAMGLMAGGDAYKPGINTNPPAQIGSNSADSNVWGTGSTSGASGPDVGSTWRGTLAIRASSVLDANPNDPYETIQDLMDMADGLTLALTVDALGPANSADYAPEVYYHGVVNQSSSTSGYWGAWENAARGVNDTNTVAGILDDVDNSGGVTPGDRYLFDFHGISGLVNDSDFITFAIVGNQDAVANEALYFSMAELAVGVPEPSTLALAAMAFVGCCFWMRRRRGSLVKNA